MTNTHSSIIRGAADPRDAAAWDRFHAAYRPLLQGYVRGRSRDLNLSWGDHEVEEVIQDVFIKLFRRLPTFVHEPARGRFRSYLYRVVMNAIAGRARPRSRPAAVDEGKVDLEAIPGRPEAAPDDRWNQDYQRAILDVVLPEVRARIEPVNPKKWASFEEHLLRHRPAAEVAAALGVTTSLVYQNASRALAEVRRLCQELFEEGLDDERDGLPG